MIQTIVLGPATMGTIRVQVDPAAHNIMIHRIMALQVRQVLRIMVLQALQVRQVRQVLMGESHFLVQEAQIWIWRIVPP
jgi:hypothetical protein